MYYSGGPSGGSGVGNPFLDDKCINGAYNWTSLFDPGLGTPLIKMAVLVHIIVNLSTKVTDILYLQATPNAKFIKIYISYFADTTQELVSLRVSLNQKIPIF